MTPEQRKARRRDLAAKKAADVVREQAVEEHRKELATVFEKDTGYDAKLDHCCPDTSDDGDGYSRHEFEYDNPRFVDWLILRYVEAAGSAYAMTEADKKAFVDTMRANEKRKPSKKERELVERYVKHGDI